MEIDDDLKKRYEQANHEAATRAHNRHDETGHALFRASIDFGLEAIRTAALINGGAVLACFAFIGVLRGSSDPQAVGLFKPLLWPAFVFTAGAVLAGTASGWAWFSQRFYLHGHNSVRYTMVHEDQYIADEPERHRYDVAGKAFQVLSVVCVIASYLCIIGGVIWGGMILKP